VTSFGAVLLTTNRNHNWIFE